MVLYPDIIGFGVSRPMEAEERISEIGDPTYEQHDHEDVDVDNKVIHLQAVFGGEGRKTEDVVKEFSHRKAEGRATKGEG